MDYQHLPAQNSKKNKNEDGRELKGKYYLDVRHKDQQDALFFLNLFQ
jgi:hypothetical protein